MSIHILVIVQAPSAHKRITSRLAAHQVNPHFRSLQELQNWLSETEGSIAALLDTQWPQYSQAFALLNRFNVPVTEFRGDFQTADQWVQNYLTVLAPVSPPVETQQQEMKSASNDEPHATSSTQETEAVLNSASTPPELTPEPVNTVELPSAARKVTAANPYRRKTRPVVRTDTSTPVVSEIQDEPQPVAPGKHRSTEPQVATPSQNRETVLKPAAETPPVFPPTRIVQVPVERVVEVPVPTTVRPRLIVVIQMWPRAGSSFVSTVLADLLAQGLPPGSVTLIEHPSQTPRFWTYFKLEQEKYVHWTQDGRGMVVPVGNVGVVPLPLDYVETEDAKDKTLAYVYRELRRPFVIVDAGPAIDDDPLMEVADDVFLVMDCDLTLIDNRAYAEQYNALCSKEINLHVVLNKWTKHAAFNDESIKDLFQGSVFLPYLSPDQMQRALWNGDFPTKYPDVAEGVAALRSRFVSQWIPKELQRADQGSSKRGPFWRRKHS